MPTPDEYLAELQTCLALETGVDAAWLAGSYGRGMADRWSDLDLHVLLSPKGDSFRTRIETWLNSISPLVLFKLLFDGNMVNALTLDGIRLDLWIHSDPPVLDPAKTQVLFDNGGRLQLALPTQTHATPAAETAAALRSQIEEFWRCISLLPTVIGRQEYIVAFQGLQVELNLLLDVLLRGNSIARESGVKRLNHYLSESEQGEIEAALALGSLGDEDLVRAHLALADLVRAHGRTLAQRWDFTYPSTLEEAVLRYVAEELGLLGLSASPPRALAR